MVEDEVHHGETWMGFCSLSEMKMMGKNFDGRLGRVYNRNGKYDNLQKNDCSLGCRRNTVELKK